MSFYVIYTAVNVPEYWTKTHVETLIVNIEFIERHAIGGCEYIILNTNTG